MVRVAGDLEKMGKDLYDTSRVLNTVTQGWLPA